MMTKKPTILIIAGGNNSRFFPLNSVTHKGFIELMGKPLIVQGLEDALKHGFEQFVLVVAHKDYESGNITNMLEKYKLSSLVKIVLQEEAKGMADAVLSAQKFLGDQFILTSPYYTRMGEISDQLWQKQQETSADCVFLASETTTPELYGILEVDNEKVLSIIEKPEKGTEPSNLKANSIYLLNQAFLQALQNTQEEEYALESAFALFAQDNFISYTITNQKLPSLKYAWHLFEVIRYLFSDKKTDISPQAQLEKTVVIDDSHGPVIIEAGARIGHTAKIVGPCYIGRDALVGDFSFVRDSSIEAGAVVGANTEVVRSIIMCSASIHYSYLADSILGPNTKVGGGLLTANKRLDRKSIKTVLKGKKTDLGTNTFGIITGEQSVIGMRVATMPGVLIGAKSVIYPGKMVYKNVDHEQTLE